MVFAFFLLRRRTFGELLSAGDVIPDALESDRPRFASAAVSLSVPCVSSLLAFSIPKKVHLRTLRKSGQHVPHFFLVSGVHVPHILVDVHCVSCLGDPSRADCRNSGRVVILRIVQPVPVVVLNSLDGDIELCLPVECVFIDDHGEIRPL